MVKLFAANVSKWTPALRHGEPINDGVLFQPSTDDWDGWEKSQSFFDASLQVFHLAQVILLISLLLSIISLGF